MRELSIILVGACILALSLIGCTETVEFNVVKQATIEGHTYSYVDIDPKEIIDNWEINIELSYRAEINEWCSIQPDVQYIINPGFNPTLKNAVVFGTRLEICF